MVRRRFRSIHPLPFTNHLPAAAFVDDLLQFHEPGQRRLVFLRAEPGAVGHVGHGEVADEGFEFGELLARLPVWRVLLVADRAVQPFYRRLGFESYDDVMALLDQTRLFDQ